MTPAKGHVIGAGLAGLAAAVALTKAGATVELSEAAAQAGGRCRSYFDPQLGSVIDNGNHLVMSGNQAVNTYLKMIGAEDRLAGPDSAAFDFVDLQSDERWTLRPNGGALPWWIFDPSRRVPQTRALDYLSLAGLLFPKRGARVDQSIDCQGPVWRRLMEPFLLAALNTEAASGSAALASAVVRETLARGGNAYRPRIAKPTLAAAFIDPAVAFLEAHGGSLKTGRRLKSLGLEGDRVSTLVFSDGQTSVAPGETVILAVPPWTAQELVPSLSAPDAFCAIANAHFKIEPPPGAPGIIGVVGGTVEWIFSFKDRISVTVSGADHLADLDRGDLAQRLWDDVARVFGLQKALPTWQVVREKRATFAGTVEQDQKRPSASTAWRNLILAGDWTQTHLPATIEGALRSGFAAARMAAQSARV